jgi:hypothetical protein
MLKALANVSPSQLLDRGLFDFGSLAAAKGDLADELDGALSAHSDLTVATVVPVTLTAAL